MRFSGGGPEYMSLPVSEQTWKQRILFFSHLAIGIPILLFLLFGWLAMGVSGILAGDYVMGAGTIGLQIFMWMIFASLLQM